MQAPVQLTGPPRRGPGGRTAPRALTTEAGFTNPNRQRVVARTGAPSATRTGQVIYRLQCGVCQRTYGCNGLDIKARLCPFCQGGTPPEAAPESVSARLFE